MKFQNILLGILIVAVVVAIIIFASGTGTNSNADQKAVQLAFWGTLDEHEGLRDALSEFNQTHGEQFRITYKHIEEDQFAQSLIESIADGKAPDMILINESNVYRLENKLAVLPLANLPIATFENQFVDISKIFLTSRGYVALPAIIDPVVMYWNKDMFTNISQVHPPKYWDQIIPIQASLTKRGSQSTVFDQSVIALGEFGNIMHAKHILSTLFLQVGIPVVQRTQNDSYVSNFSPAVRVSGEPPADSTLRFYVDFANPMKTLYSWNRTLPNSRDAFISEKLALYIGKASDYSTIKEKNPHLNFGVSLVPQVRDAKTEVTSGSIYGLAAVKASPRNAAALRAITALVYDKNFIIEWSSGTKLPPARKDLLSKTPTDSVQPIFYQSALRAKTWIDPDADKTSAIMKQSVEGLLSGKFAVPSDATAFLSKEFSALIK